MSTIADKCVRVKYSPKKMGDKRTDKEVSESVADNYGANKDVVFVSKKILQCPELISIKEFDSETRKVFKEKTAPWGDDGWRIIQAKDHKDLKSYIDQRTAMREKLVDEFINRYSYLVADDVKNLGGIRKETDYPAIEKVIESFAIDEDPFETDVISDKAPDFRADLSDEEVREIETNLTKSLTKKHENATAVVYGRVLEAVEKVVERLATPETRFHESVIDNLKKIVEVLPTANFDADPNLDAIAKRIKENLLYKTMSGNVKDFRFNAEKREEAKKEATEIVQDIDSILGKMKGAM